jgi:uncharacterized membrane protein YqjE
VATTGTGPEAARDDLRRGREEARRLGASTAEIVSDLRELARLEMDLARAEMADNRSRLTSAIAGGTLAAVSGFWMVGFAGWAAMSALAEVWPAWAAALATAGGWLALALLAAGFAWLRMRRFSATPRRTLQSLREDIAWARGLTKPNGASGRNGR